MNAIKYMIEDAKIPKNSLYTKYRFIDYIQSKNKIAQSISFIFCSDNYLQKINGEFLNHKDLTDVITFDLSENTGNLLEAEIYINLKRAKINAKKYNQTFNDEVARLIIHGLLHLLGFNDQTFGDKVKMKKSEDQYLKMVNNMLYS